MVTDLISCLNLGTLCFNLYLTQFVLKAKYYNHQKKMWLNIGSIILLLLPVE